MAKSVHTLALHQMENGTDVFVGCPSSSELSGRLTSDSVQTLSWEAVRSPMRGLWREGRCLAQLVKRCRPHIVHLHSSKAGLVGRMVLRGRVPTIFTPRGWSFLALQNPARQAAYRWESYAARWCDAIQCVSEGEFAISPPGARELTRLVHNGVNLDVWRVPSKEESEAFRKAFGLVNTPTVACVGRFCRQKGQDILLAAWPTVIKHVPNARLLLVGADPDTSSSGGQIVPGVLFLGDRRDVWSLLATTDVFALPSRWEGQSLALLEAMATARCVVASRAAPGVVDTMGHSAAGIVELDSVSFANALIERLTNPALRLSEGDKLRMRAEKHFSSSRMLAGIDEMYELTLSGAL